MPFIENASSVKLSAKSELTWFLFEDPQSAAVFRARHHEAVRWRFTLFTIHFILQWELVEISVIYCLKSKSYFYRSELLPNAFSKCNSRGGGGVLPYISPGMCCPNGSGFRAILVWKRVYTLPILVWNRYGFLGELRECMNVIYRFNSKWIIKKEKYANSKWIWRIFLFVL